MTRFLVPIRGFDLSKQKLRHHLGESHLRKIITYLLDKTIQVLIDHNIEITILTADPQVIEKYPQLNVVIDAGNDLNSAIINYVSEQPEGMFGLIMPDLPGLTTQVFKYILDHNDEYFVVPTHDAGTAVTLLPKYFFLQGYFGPKSSERFLRRARDENQALKTLIISELSHDLDTFADYLYWKDIFKSLMIES